MTKPRTEPNRELFGILGSFIGAGKEQSWWNRMFEQNGIDAFMDRYPTAPDQLPLRLSEMFHFDRRGYIVSERLSQSIIPLLDTVDSVSDDGAIDTVWNDGGVMRGFWCEGDREKRWEIWSSMQYSV